MKINKNKKSGLTLIEALIWFAIFASILAGVFVLYKNTRDANQISQVNKELSQIYVKANALYTEGNTGFTLDEASSGSIVNELAINLGIIPSTLKVKGSTIENTYGGVVMFVSRATGFVVQYTKIPTGNACMNIVNGQKKAGWEFVVVGGLSRVYYNNTYTINAPLELCKGDNGTAASSITLQFASCNGGC